MNIFTAVAGHTKLTQNAHLLFFFFSSDLPLFLVQLRYSGIFEAVVIRQSGFPFRRTHHMFKTAYYMLLDSDLRENAIMSEGRAIPAKEAYVITRVFNNVIYNEV
jgi:myosin heavy subunit